jgi:hypothetical protein
MIIFSAYDQRSEHCMIFIAKTISQHIIIIINNNNNNNNNNYNYIVILHE